MNANNIANDISSTIVNGKRIDSLRSLLNLFEEYNEILIAKENACDSLFDDPEFSEAYNMQCALECEEFEQQKRQEHTCSACGTVWEDKIAARHCPCSE